VTGSCRDPENGRNSYLVTRWRLPQAAGVASAGTGGGGRRDMLRPLLIATTAAIAAAAAAAAAVADSAAVHVYSQVGD